MSRHRRLLVALAAALIALGAGLARRPDVAVGAPRDDAGAPFAGPAAAASEMASVASAGFVHGAASSATAPPSLAARVDAWLRSDDPRDAMRAYQAVFQCLLARRRARAAELPASPLAEPPGQDEARQCGDLRSDQVQQRLAALERAARAGVTDAAANFIQEGPGGNGLLADVGTTDPTPPTPDWLARRDDYIDRALANCDVGLATYLGVTQRDHDARLEAQRYWLARLACPGQAPADTTPVGRDPRAQAYLDGLAIDGWTR